MHEKNCDYSDFSSLHGLVGTRPVNMGAGFANTGAVM